MMTRPDKDTTRKHKTRHHDNGTKRQYNKLKQTTRQQKREDTTRCNVNYCRILLLVRLRLLVSAIAKHRVCYLVLLVPIVQLASYRTSTYWMVEDDKYSKCMHVCSNHIAPYALLLSYIDFVPTMRSIDSLAIETFYRRVSLRRRATDKEIMSGTFLDNYAGKANPIRWKKTKTFFTFVFAISVSPTYWDLKT